MALSRKVKGTSGLAWPRSIRPSNVRPDVFVLAGTTSNQKCDNSTIGGRSIGIVNAHRCHSSIHHSNRTHDRGGLDSPESVDLIGKINVLGTAIVFDATEG